MQTGIYEHPDWYPGLTTHSALEDFQQVLLNDTQKKCRKPCPHGSSSGACHTAMPGEVCFGHLMWAMQEGIYAHPEWYPGLSKHSASEDFQLFLHSDKSTTCQKPCPRQNSTMPDASTSGPCHDAVPGEDCFVHVMWAMQ